MRIDVGSISKLTKHLIVIKLVFFYRALSLDRNKQTMSNILFKIFVFFYSGSDLNLKPHRICATDSYLQNLWRYIIYIYKCQNFELYYPYLKCYNSFELYIK